MPPVRIHIPVIPQLFGQRLWQRQHTAIFIGVSIRTVIPMLLSQVLLQVHVGTDSNMYLYPRLKYYAKSHLVSLQTANMSSAVKWKKNNAKSCSLKSIRKTSNFESVVQYIVSSGVQCLLGILDFFSLQNTIKMTIWVDCMQINS